MLLIAERLALPAEVLRPALPAAGE